VSVEPAARRRRPPPKRARRGLLIAGAVALLLAFLLGIALGKALDDNPDPAKTRTFIRTFQPFPPRATVTVTTSG
jgi:hypothetical protein